MGLFLAAGGALALGSGGRVGTFCADFTGGTLYFPHTLPSMALERGTKLGPYQIESPIAAGGQVTTCDEEIWPCPVASMYKGPGPGRPKRKSHWPSGSGIRSSL